MKWEGREGQRPVEWWLYEKKMWPPDEREAEVLFEMGELKGVELQKLLEQWREACDKALQPDFAYCIGHAKEGDTFATWLEGNEAREAHYNLVGIPRSLVKRWDEELR